jgi:hypothetical protein
MFYVAEQWVKLSAAERIEFANSAYAASFRCLELCPEWNLAHLIHTQNVIFEAVLSSDLSGFRFAKRRLDEMLGREWGNEPLSNTEKSFAFNCRAQCQLFLGELESARRDYGDSIRLDPGDPQLYLNRSKLLRHLGSTQLAEADERHARRLLESRSSAEPKD